MADAEDKTDFCWGDKLMVKRYPEIIIVDLDLANTIYTVTLPTDTKSYTIKTRGNTAFKLAYRSGGIEAGDYLSIPSGSGESEDGLSREDSITIYAQGEVDGEVLEVKRWR